MEPDHYKLIEQAISEGLTVKTWLLFLVSAIVAGLGAYFGSYLNTSGTNRAIKEGFAESQTRLKEQTDLVEQIKGEVATKTGESIENLKYELGIAATRHQLALQSHIQFKERQLSEFYGPIYALLMRIRPIDDLWNQGQVKEVDDAIIKVIRASNDRTVDLLLTKSHLIRGHTIPQSYVGFLTHVAIWHAFWDNPQSDWSAYQELRGAHYDPNFEREIFQTTEELKQELDALYQRYGLLAASSKEEKRELS